MIIYNELSETLRGEALRDAAEKKRFLEKQLESVIDPFMKEKFIPLGQTRLKRRPLPRPRNIMDLQ